LFMVAMCHPVSAQVTRDQLSDMLAKTGIPEDTLRARLIKKGFDPDQIRPDQVDEFQAVILETIHEIESEQAPPPKETNVPEKKVPEVPKPEVKNEPKPE